MFWAMSWSAMARWMPHGALAAVAGLAALGVAGTAYAQDFPVKPLRLIIPFGAGGVADTTSRLIAEKMSERLGQPIVVENITTASPSGRP